ncbi:NAD(P)H-binding protein [Bradyrhizobium sp. CCBAU 11357]|uniref:NAD(P)H-binding protein n=1 Tax=Bradyrhizobium sp. CCBAU 11357 TaxID=1630808 RepID=UPI0023048E34|nr:NAD(P)H-binding protein [Bradyrhizobium sp. CCBAU 11357]
MFIVIGANGRVGSAVASTLLNAGRPVTAVLHSSNNEADWRKRGAQTVVVDVRNTDALRAVFRTGTRAFLLNPNADVSADTDREEHATVRSIVAAVDGSGLEKVVAASTMAPSRASAAAISISSTISSRRLPRDRYRRPYSEAPTT